MRFLGALAGLWALFALPTLASADVWPSRTIRLVLPFPAGGPSDLLARSVAQTLSVQVKQPVIVDNKPGGSGMIGNDAVAKAAPDGYTLGLASAGSMAIVPNLLKMPYDRDRDLQTITVMARVPEVVVANPKNVPATTLQELLTLARERPGTLTFGSTGNGSPVHLVLERMKQLAHVDILHIPYKGAAIALNDILAGQIDLTAADAPGILPHLRSGALRALAMTDTERLPALPDVPTFAEAGLPGVEMMNWYVVIAPAALPAPLLEQLTAALNNVAHDPATKSRLLTQGLTLVGTTPEQATAFVQAETKKWGDVARAADVHLD
jgi:tripartite-type tricarboxylate transporter receptor subunit TctC